MTKSILRYTCIMMGVLPAANPVVGQIPQTNNDLQVLQVALEESRAVANPSLRVPDRYQLERRFQSGPKCGPNALYYLLKLHGADVRYEQIVDLVVTGEKGSSMLQLSECARQFGVETEIRTNVAPDDLKSSVLPAIVHLTAVGSVRDPAAPADHFLLILRQDESGQFCGIDTTEMSRVDYTRESLARTMSGNVLFVTKSNRAVANRLVALFRYLWISVGLVWVMDGFMIIRAWRMKSDGTHGFK